MHKLNDELETKNILEEACTSFEKGDYLQAEKFFRQVFTKNHSENKNIFARNEDSYIKASVYFTRMLLKKHSLEEAFQFSAEKIRQFPRAKELLEEFYKTIKCLSELDIISLLKTIYQEKDYPFLASFLKDKQAKKTYLYFQNKKAPAKERFIDSFEYIAANRLDASLALLSDDIKRLMRLKEKIEKENNILPQMTI